MAKPAKNEMPRCPARRRREREATNLASPVSQTVAAAGPSDSTKEARALKISLMRRSKCRSETSVFCSFPTISPAFKLLTPLKNTQTTGFRIHLYHKIHAHSDTRFSSDYSGGSRPARGGNSDGPKSKPIVPTLRRCCSCRGTITFLGLR
jgi:hypothetical protein